jgi:hypothetical protein
MRRSRIVRDGKLDAWVRGLSRFDKPDEVDEQRWEQITEIFFGRTQENVHVISGVLKASGERRTWREGHRVTGEVKSNAPYAGYEFRRGGDHDALRRGYEVTQQRYQQALGEILKSKVDRWD